jgi:integrase
MTTIHNGICLDKKPVCSVSNGLENAILIIFYFAREIYFPGMPPKRSERITRPAAKKRTLPTEVTPVAKAKRTPSAAKPQAAVAKPQAAVAKPQAAVAKPQAAVAKLQAALVTQDADSDDELVSASDEVLMAIELPAVYKAKIEELRMCGIPAESAERYLTEYNKFHAWAELNIGGLRKVMTEDIVKAYYADIKDEYAASSLFTKFSMLKAVVDFKHTGLTAHASCWKELTKYTKHAAVGEKPQKAEVFLPEHLENYIVHGEASPAQKLLMLLAWYGSLRPAEAYNLTVNDVTHNQVDGSFKFVVEDRKTKANRMVSAWTVPGTITNWASPVPHFLRVMQARRIYQDKTVNNQLPPFLFMKMMDGEIRNQRMGENQLGELAKKVSEFNDLSGRYTGYSFRRSSATALAAAGCTDHQLTTHLGHKNLGTAVEYVDSSVSAQCLASMRLAHGAAAPNGHIAAAGVAVAPAVPQSSWNVTHNSPITMTGCNVTIIYGDATGRAVAPVVAVEPAVPKVE